ncbi:MAG: hypothetical protein ACD_39C00894G0002 [uncultured bacterium]|nr:MAG: hypothetical protein ACD_39C00894G0002 [uncultured bacterium]
MLVKMYQALRLLLNRAIILSLDATFKHFFATPLSIGLPAKNRQKNRDWRSLDRVLLCTYNQEVMNHQIRNIFMVFLLAAFAVSGCSQNEELPISQTGSGSRMLSSDPVQMSTVETSVKTAPDIKVSPLEYAQKEYLDTYNEYVRLLRESGPQTIDTLQALALYQKKYQIYQMLLKADGDKGK